jgi:hypothetical protein
MSSAARRMQARPAPRVTAPRRRQRSRSPDPVITRSSTLSTEPGGCQATLTPLQATVVKRSKKRENQNSATSSSNHNPSRGHQNDADPGPVARGDKSKAKSLSSKSRHAIDQSTESMSSGRTVVSGRRERDRSLTRGDRSSKRASSVEPIEADGDLQLTGPIAAAQYTRLQSEVEKLREVRFQPVVISAIYSWLTRSHSKGSGRRT